MPDKPNDPAAKLPAVDEYLTTSDVKSRGWTDGMIRRFLPVADATRANPRYRFASPTRLYLESRVEAVEASDEFVAVDEASMNRRSGAAKAVDTKRARLLAYVDGLVIEVPRIPFDDLVKLACESYNRREDQQASEFGMSRTKRLATPESSPEFLDRISVNHLRHQMTGYEAELTRIYGKVGTRDAYLKLRSKIFEAIADTYPALKEQCEEQEKAALTRK